MPFRVSYMRSAEPLRVNLSTAASMSHWHFSMMMCGETLHKLNVDFASCSHCNASEVAQIT